MRASTLRRAAKQKFPAQQGSALQRATRRSAGDVDLAAGDQASCRAMTIADPAAVRLLLPDLERLLLV